MSMSSLVTRLEDREAAKTGQPLKSVRAALAGRLKVPPGSLEEHRRGRVKDPRVSFVEKIKGYWINELEKEIQALSHEVQLLRASGASPDSDEILAAETHLAQARKLLGKT